MKRHCPGRASASAGPQLSEMVWDVDNDGDGIPDSVWLDIGLPIQTDASGRRYRPLVAILCQDLDGRLNVNAHSSPAHRQHLYADFSSWPANVPLSSAPANGTQRPSPPFHRPHRKRCSCRVAWGWARPTFSWVICWSGRFHQRIDTAVSPQLFRRDD